MIQTSKQYPLHDCALYKVRTKRRLAKLLNMSSSDIRRIEQVIEYHEFERPKKKGVGKRRITAPERPLKRIQSRVLRLLSGIEKPFWVVSSTKGMCHIDNAPMHKNNPYVLTMDIASFFDNCERDYVYRFFRDTLLAEPDCAKILTDICTFKNGIPTGTPTSQLLAYLAYKDMFDEINSFAQARGMLFTLYVDDMTFSSPVPFPPDSVENGVRIILRRYGHKSHPKKCKYSGASDYKVITGVCITPEKRLSVPNSLRERTIDGFEKQLNTPTEKGRSSTLGRIQAARRIEENIFPEVERLTRASL